jgi:hypothetical protein
MEAEDFRFHLQAPSSLLSAHHPVTRTNSKGPEVPHSLSLLTLSREEDGRTWSYYTHDNVPTLPGPPTFRPNFNIEPRGCLTTEQTVMSSCKLESFSTYIVFLSAFPASANSGKFGRLETSHRTRFFCSTSTPEEFA